MFYSYWFLTSWKQIFAPNINLIIFLFRKNEYLVGMIPVMECASGMKIAGDPELFDYQQLIIENDMEREVINSFFDYLVDEDWKQLDLSSVSGDSQKDILIENKDINTYLKNLF